MSEYEFTGEQNRTVQSLSLHIRITAIMLALFGFSWLLPMSSLINNEGLASLLGTPQLYSMMLFLVMAALVWRVSPHLQRIVTTEGKDITELLAGLRALEDLNNVGRILLLIGVVVLSLRLFI